MYRFLNYNRAPFLPAYPDPITFSDREASLTRRISGEPIAPPACGSRELKEIVLKACAYHPSGRYENPVRMREALEEILHHRKNGTTDVSEISQEAEKQVWREEISAGEEQTESTEESTVSIFREYERPKEMPKEMPEEQKTDIPAVKEKKKDCSKMESILRGILIGLGVLNVYEIVTGPAILMIITLPPWFIILLIWLRIRKKKQKGENQNGKN